MNYAVENIYGKLKTKSATVEVEGSKSITARALLLAALADGRSTLHNAQFSEDCAAFLNCLKSLGIECEVTGKTVNITGCGGRLPVKEGKIYVSSAGTAARFLTALLAFSDGEFIVDASGQMKRRPIAPLVKSLVSAGAQVDTTDGTFPLKIRGTSSVKDLITVDVTESSQFLSALLISGVCAKNGVRIKPVGTHGEEYIKMTLDMMWSFGVNVEKSGDTYVVKGRYTAKKYEIEPDVSAAAYFYAAGKILGADVKVKGVLPHSMQGDIKFINLLKNFDGGRVDMSAFSDQTLTLAAIAPYLKRPTEIYGVSHIRKQECDRLNAIHYNLSAMGIRCEEFDDGIKIYTGAPKPAHIKTFGDHRVAMAFAVTGLRAGGIVIEDAGVCGKTFKDYFKTLDGFISALTK